MGMRLPRALKAKVLHPSSPPAYVLDGPVLTAVVTVPGVAVVAEANCRDHWAVKRRRILAQQAATLTALVALGRDVRDRMRAARTVTVRFVRIGGKWMDSDNLVGGFKAIRDALAMWLLVDDGSDRLRWEWPAQEGGERGFRVELTASN